MAELFTCHGQRAYTVMDGTKKAYRIVAALGDENGLVEVNDDDYLPFPMADGLCESNGHV